MGGGWRCLVMWDKSVEMLDGRDVVAVSQDGVCGCLVIEDPQPVYCSSGLFSWARVVWRLRARCAQAPAVLSSCVFITSRVCHVDLLRHG